MPNPFLLPSRLALRAIGVVIELSCIAAFIAGVWTVGFVMQGA